MEKYARTAASVRVAFLLEHPADILHAVIKNACLDVLAMGCLCRNNKEKRKAAWPDCAKCWVDALAKKNPCGRQKAQGLGKRKMLANISMDIVSKKGRKRQHGNEKIASTGQNRQGI